MVLAPISQLHLVVHGVLLKWALTGHALQVISQRKYLKSIN
jgi:hypothetical protein